MRTEHRHHRKPPFTSLLPGFDRWTGPWRIIRHLGLIEWCRWYQHKNKHQLVGVVVEPDHGNQVAIRAIDAPQWTTIRGPQAQV